MAGFRLAPLTQRLFTPEAELGQRLELAGLLSQPNGLMLANPLPGCQAWPAVCDVLLQAAKDKRPTLVYGDYDVDGTFSVGMLFRWLRNQGVPGNYFLPSRMLHGYGLDIKIVQQAVDHGYRTLIALDCGTTDHSAINLAVEAGLKVAVIDHHQPQGGLPVPLLNPHTEGALPPLCTAGLVALALAALQEHVPGSLVGDELELAGLATLADIVPLEPLNWGLAHAGLVSLPGTINHGLHALKVYSGLDGLDTLTPRQAQFSLIPRLNAAGRLRSARISLELLLALGQSEARQAAQLLEQLNTERQELSRQVARRAVLAALDEPDAAGVALYNPDWHIGVLGIAAAQVANQLSKPAIILANAPGDDGETGVLSGSVRTCGDIDIMAALGECSSLLVSFGGHSAAAGIKVRRESLPEFKVAWAAAVVRHAEQVPPHEVEPATPPALAQLTDFTAQAEENIWQLIPFGPGFEPTPMVLDDCRVERASLMGRDKTHLALTVTDGDRSVRLTGFQQSHLYPRLRPGMPIRPLVTLEPDNYQNQRTIMLRLLGIEK